MKYIKFIYENIKFIMKYKYFLLKYTFLLKIFLCLIKFLCFYKIYVFIIFSKIAFFCISGRRLEASGFLELLIYIFHPQNSHFAQLGIPFVVFLPFFALFLHIFAHFFWPPKNPFFSTFFDFFNFLCFIKFIFYENL